MAAKVKPWLRPGVQSASITITLLPDDEKPWLVRDQTKTLREETRCSTPEEVGEAVAEKCRRWLSTGRYTA